MSADGKVTIEVGLDDSQIAKDLDRLKWRLEKDKQSVASYAKAYKDAQDAMANATSKNTKRLEHELLVARLNYEQYLDSLKGAATEYNNIIKDIVAAGAADSNTLGRNFYANTANIKNPVYNLSELIKQGKVSGDVLQKLEAHYETVAKATDMADTQEAEYNDTTSKNIQLTEAQLAKIERLKEELAAANKEVNRYAEQVMTKRAQYQSGLISDEDLEHNEERMAQNLRLVKMYLTKREELEQAISELQRGSVDVNYTNTEETYKLDSERAAVELLTGSIKELNKVYSLSPAMVEALGAAHGRATIKLKAEAQSAKLAKAAEVQASREAAAAEREARGRITGTLGLLGMLNPKFTRLSYAIRQFSHVGGKSFTELEDKIKGVGKTLAELPPQVKVAMGAAAATIGVFTAGVVTAIKSVKLMLNAISSFSKLAVKAGKAFAKFYDFDEYFGSIDKMIEAYNELQSKEVALEALMRQRMGANDELVKSIKDLIDAEQDEGVVSRQLQTSALQQLSAYTTQADTLRTLLPVLNDYIVQMYGVNATEKQAESAAKLFGKAMKGQTETLRRAGYVTEAQAKAIKNAGTETERAALLAKYMGERCNDMNKILAQTDAGKQRKLANSMADVQREFGQAATTLKTTFIPIATKVLAVLARMATYATALANSIAKLFGNTSKSAATAIGEIEDVADATVDAGKKAKEVNNSLGIDELNVLQQPSGDDSGGADSGFDTEQLLTDKGIIEEINADMDEFIAKLTDAYTAGYVLGSTMKTALSNIPWEDIKAGAESAGTAIAQFANGVVDSGVIAKVGTTIGEAVNTVTNALHGFVKNFNFEGLGSQIAQSLENAIKTIDWKKLGDTIGTALSGLMDMVSQFFESFDFYSIATAVVNLICGIDWASLLGSIVRLIANVTTTILLDFPATISNALLKLVVNIASMIGEYFDKRIKVCGGNVIKGFLQGVLDALVGIGKWLLKNFINPVIQHIKRLFGIEGSISEKLSAIGKSLVRGLTSGIKSLIKDVKDTCGKIKTAVTEVFDSIKTKVGNITDKIKTNVSNKFKSIHSSIKSTLNDMSTTISSIWNTIHTGISTNVGNIKKSVGAAFDSIKTNASKVWNSIKSAVVDTVELIHDKIGVPLYNIKLSFKQTFEGILKDVIKPCVNSIIGAVEAMAKGIAKGLNLAIGALNKLNFEIPDWMPLVGGESFGLNLPTIDVDSIKLPRLATGAVLPANNPFLAVVGDQTQGTNIEAPLSTIQQAVSDVMNPYLRRLVELAEDIDNKELSVNIGDRDIARANNRGQRMLGAQLRTT